MRFNCSTKVDRNKSWHTWFAWYPVRIDQVTCVWLERVERRGQLEYLYDGTEYWEYEYRLIDHD